MKYILSGLVIFIVLISCDQKSQLVEGKSSENLNAQPDSIPYVDSIDDPETIMSKTDSLLLNPFDLVAYKKSARGANSGSCREEKYFFKPDTVGMYYSYYLIGGHRMGYIGKDTLHKSIRKSGIDFNVYKPKDADWTMYNDPNEILIEFKAKYNDFNLPELAFIGLTKTEIIKELGKPSFTKRGCLVYTFEDRALLLHTENKVDWLKYVHLKEELKETSHYPNLYKLKMFNL